MLLGSHDMRINQGLQGFLHSLIKDISLDKGKIKEWEAMTKQPVQEQLHSAFPGRAKQIDRILGYMGEPCTPTPPAILVNGNSSLGKTTVVKAILSAVLGDHTPSRYAFLNCVECHTPRLIFEHAIFQFRNAPQQFYRDHDLNHNLQESRHSQDTNTAGPARTQSKPIKEADNGSRKRKRKDTDQERVWDKCESTNEFVEWCRRICDENTDRSVDGHKKVGVQDPHKTQQETRYLVLDRAERLRDSAPDLIPVLMRLQELTGRNICVILISTIVWEKFRSKTGGYEPIVVNFPQYSKDMYLKRAFGLFMTYPSFRTLHSNLSIPLFYDASCYLLDVNRSILKYLRETKDILERDLPEGEDKDLYTRFVDLVYDVFQRNCKDLNEIRHLVALLFPLYVKPVKEGKIQKHEALKLHRHIQGYFVEAMDKLYLREISSTEWSDRTLSAASGSSNREQSASSLNSSSVGDSGAARTATSVSSSERAVMSAVDVQNTFDLPYFTKFILIASFLASYNPPRLDIRYFAKVSNQGGKMTKRAKVAAAKKHGHDQMGSKLRQQLLGPKIFPIERMLAIFYSILDDEVEENVNVHTQVASLVSLRLLQRVTPMDKLDSIKCKCNVSYDMIKALAKSTKFDIDKYLYDFT